MRLRLTLLFALLASPALAQPADLVLRGGKIITVDSGWHIAQAAAVRGGRFIAIGDDASVAGYVGPNTQLVELAGHTVVPGLLASDLHPVLYELNGHAVKPN